jgi:hypothetical protein
VTANSLYNFTPTGSDPDGNTLTFSIAGKPTWASFSATTGELSGTPGTADVGNNSNIVISVGDGELTSSLAGFTIAVMQGNRAPTISGTPPTQVNANNLYSFTPTGSDPDGDTLTFSISGKPTWASFDAETGKLSGMLTDGDVGTYNDILITVSDNSETASLSVFSISVQAISLGSVTLDWTPPTENEDGTALTDLAGYTIYWGTTSGNYTSSVNIDNPGISRYVIENLAPGTYEFVATASNLAGVESAHSNPATKVVD